MQADLSRRSFLHIAAAGSAATMPAAVLAAPDRVTADPVQLSDEAQLEACIAKLKAILARLHPECQAPEHVEVRTAGGSREISFTVLRGIRRFLGDGVYETELNDGRYLCLCYVQRLWSDMDRAFFFQVTEIIDGEMYPVRECVTEQDLVRKVG